MQLNKPTDAPEFDSNFRNINKDAEPLSVKAGFIA